MRLRQLLVRVHSLCETRPTTKHYTYKGASRSNKSQALLNCAGRLPTVRGHRRTPRYGKVVLKYKPKVISNIFWFSSMNVCLPTCVDGIGRILKSPRTSLLLTTFHSQLRLFVKTQWGNAILLSIYSKILSAEWLDLLYDDADWQLQSTSQLRIVWIVCDNVATAHIHSIHTFTASDD